MNTPEIIVIGPNDKPLLVDPASVGCGFVLCAKKELPFFEDKSRAHKVLETNKTKLWEAVRRHDPDIPVLFLVASQHIPNPVEALAYAFNALNKSGEYPGYSMTLDSMAVSPDGGKTLVHFYAGLNWKSSRQELVVAGPQRILPGKPEDTATKQRAKAERIPATASTKARLSTNDEKHIRQVIIQLSAGAAEPPKFGGLMLPPDTNPGLNLQTHCADFFSMDDGEGPFLMIRADGKTEQFRDAPLFVAYTFCRFDAGGLFATFVGIDLPGEDTPWGGVVESKIPLDVEIEFAVDRIDRALRRDEIHMCFAGASSNRGKYVDLTGSLINFTPPRCEFDRVFPVPPQVREILTKEFAELQAYHASLAPAKRNPQGCMDQFNTAFPQRMHPVIGYRFVAVPAPGIPQLETLSPAETVPPAPRCWTLTDLFFFLAFAALWLLLAPLFAYAGYALLRPIMRWQVHPPALQENAFFAVVTQTIYYLPIMAYIYFLVAVHYQQPLWAGLKWGGMPLPRAVRCFVGGIALALFTLAALVLLPDKQSFPLEQLFTSRGAAYLVGGFAVLVAPFMEELIFRGVLFAFFENLVGLRFAVVTTALLFAGLHLPEYWGAWHHAALILLVGVVFSVARGVTGSLAPSVILHLAYNTTLMTGLFIGTQHFREIQGVVNH